MISAPVEHALRIAIELAVLRASAKAADLAKAQGVPLSFLANKIMPLLRRGGIVNSRQGFHGGYWLTSSPGDITLADVIRCVKDPIVSIVDSRPEDRHYPGKAAGLRDVWIDLEAMNLEFLEHLTLEAVVRGEISTQ